MECKGLACPPNVPDNGTASECRGCLSLFKTMADSFNSPIDTEELLEIISQSIVQAFTIQGCHFLILKWQEMKLEQIAFYGTGTIYLKDGEISIDDKYLQELRAGGILVQDLLKEPGVGIIDDYKKEDIKSLVSVPLKRGAQTIGIMLLTSSEQRAYNSCEMLIMETIAQFSNSLLLQSIFNNVLKKVTYTVHSSLDLFDVLNSIVEVITEELRVRGCAIRLLDRDNNKFLLKASHGLSRNYLEKGPVLADKSISDVLDGKCVAIYNVENDDRIQYPDEARNEGISSLLSVPLIVYKKVIGDLRIYTNKPYVFSENEINMMKAIGEQCALAIRDAQMYTSMKEKYDDLMSDFHQWFDDLSLKET